MIHISIPSHRSLTDPDDPFNKFTVYDIHINGAFHASIRYNLLFSLHEKLVAAFGFRLKAPEFPPKKIWRLDAKSLNERREGLAKYLQGVIANPDVARHIILEKAFLDFQVNSFSTSISQIIKLEILLPDGRPVYVECCSDDPTNAVMEKFCRVIAMNETNARYFGLFLARPRLEQTNDENGESALAQTVHFTMLCIRWLKNFESPFISQQLANSNAAIKRADGQLHKIIIHRIIWDPSVEESLLEDPGSLKVLYLQALNDIRIGILKLPKEVKEKLTVLQEFGDFKQFVRLCHLQPDYGFEWMGPVRTEEMTIYQLKVGRRQLILESQDKQTKVNISRLFSKRIRVWRVSHSEIQPQLDMTFQLEYLIRGNEFRTVTLHTEPCHAVLLSLFLQSIADEILQTQDKVESPISYKFDDNISIKAIESLEASRINSVVADDLSIKSFSSNSNEITDANDYKHQITNGHSNDKMLIKLISYQMPFTDHDNFEDVTDADL